MLFSHFRTISSHSFGLFTKASFSSSQSNWIRLLSFFAASTFVIGTAAYQPFSSCNNDYSWQHSYHSKVPKSNIDSDKMKIVQVPVLEDNYAYLLIDEATNKAAAVDPANPSLVIAAAEQHNVELTHILTTHHHWDHADGNPEMVERISSLVVVGGDDRIPALTQKVTAGDLIKIGDLEVQVLSTPCHTSGHVVYFVPDPVAPAVFTGDTLFIGGCGRFFEGNGQQMYEALINRIGSLPKETRVYCGHEYTVSNLLFGQAVEPANEVLAAKLHWAQQQREQKLSTIPSTLAEEWQINPFMRVREASVHANLGLPENADPVEVMQILRDKKNNWKPGHKL